MDIPLIISIVVLNLILAWFYKKFLDKYYSAKVENDRKYLSSLLALNISHIHDAANFFTLIKNRVEENDTKNFAKGASYHFRTLFEELKQHKSRFDEFRVDDAEQSQIELLYQKETIDLKDLLELELLQLSSSTYDRIAIQDKSSSEHALIEGNFTLLSKAILNLVENAIKYTDKQIKLELSDKEQYWQIRINSYGKSIPEALVAEILSKEISSAGHGLSSLVQIMDYHQAKLEIDTFAGSGTCITLKFPKYSSNTKINPARVKLGSDSKPKFFSLSLLMLILVLSISVFFLTKAFWINKTSNKNLNLPKPAELKSIELKPIEKSVNKTIKTKTHRVNLPVDDQSMDSLIDKQDQDLGLQFEL